MSQPRPTSFARARGAVAALAASALLLAACGGDSGGGSGDGGEDDKIRIGISLPLTGDFSEPGEGVQRGYEIWRDMVNEDGGLLGREVELIVMGDQSNADRVVSDYEALITQEEVDLVFGPFSSRLVLASARTPCSTGSPRPSTPASCSSAAGRRTPPTPARPPSRPSTAASTG